MEILYLEMIKSWLNKEIHKCMGSFRKREKGGRVWYEWKRTLDGHP